MQLKPVTLIAILSLVAAPLLISGCITSNQEKETQITTQLSVSAQYQGPYTPTLPDTPDPLPGYQYVMFYVTVKNLNETGDNSLGDPFYFTTFDNNNQSYNTSPVTTTASGAIKIIQNSKPSDTTAGSLVFEVRQGFTPQKLVYNDGSNTVTVTF